MERSTDGFKELMDKEFGYLVCPLAFNITIEISSKYFQTEKGYGSPEINNIKSGELILYDVAYHNDYDRYYYGIGDTVKLSTEFPTIQNEKGEKKPGPLLLKLKKAIANDEAKEEEVKEELVAM
jgi:hypothetical protein